MVITSILIFHVSFCSADCIFWTHYSVTKPHFLMIMVDLFCNNNNIIIITLFQEDNIFGTNVSLTYGPQIQRHTCV